MTSGTRERSTVKGRTQKWPDVGDVLVHHFAGDKETAHATVVKVDIETRMVHVRIGNNVYKSLSAAAKAVSGQHTNGWIFWGLKKQRHD